MITYWQTCSFRENETRVLFVFASCRISDGVGFSILYDNLVAELKEKGNIAMSCLNRPATISGLICSAYGYGCTVTKRGKGTSDRISRMVTINLECSFSPQRFSVEERKRLDEYNNMVTELVEKERQLKLLGEEQEQVGARERTGSLYAGRNMPAELLFCHLVFSLSDS